MRSAEFNDTAFNDTAPTTRVQIDVREPTSPGKQLPLPGQQGPGGPTVVSVAGEVDASNSRRIESRVASLITRRVDVIIDLTAVSFMGSCGLWAVVGLPQIAHGYDVGCAVVTSDAVDRLLQVVNHCRPPWVFDDLPSATKAFAAAELRLAS